MPRVEKTLVGAYGTLRKGALNEGRMAEHKATFVKRTKIAGYKLYDHYADGDIPFILEGEETDTVVVDVFRMGPKGLKVVDELEQYNAEWEPENCRYIRKEVQTVDGETIHAYVWNRTLRDNDTIVESGDWLEHLNINAPVSEPEVSEIVALVNKAEALYTESIAKMSEYKAVIEAIKAAVTPVN